VNQRTTHFDAELRRLLHDPTQREVFRIDDATVGVTNGPLSKAILAARPMYEPERIVFKPIRGVPVSKVTLSTVMKAVVQDARRVAEASPDPDVPLEGIWPQAGYRYLQRRLYASDPWPIRALVHRIVNQAGLFKPALDVVMARLMDGLPFETDRHWPRSWLARLRSGSAGRQSRSIDEPPNRSAPRCLLS
jgi:hypothetical protein